jgi:hypothetical protein
LPGGYSYNQESIPQIIDYVNSAGQRVRMTNLYSSPATIGEDAQGNQTYILTDQGCASYDPNKHSFT